MESLKDFKICFLLIVSLLTSSLYAQTGTKETIQVKGRIVDLSNEGAAGATILIKGTSQGTSTDFDGNYSINVESKEAILVISYVGFVTQEIVVGDKKIINVVLSEDTEMLDDIVVIAYGAKTKATVTGALSTISNKELTRLPVSSVTNILGGSLPGVASVQSSGQPGKDAATIYVRGAGSLSNGRSKPLILVDGVERDFSLIDPNEIESISVLKDASSTAVFGVRGANGVVLVTTRRGRVGEPTISFSSSVGFQQPISLVSQASSYEYAKFWNIKKEADNVADQRLYFTREAIEAYRTGSDPIIRPNISWKDYMFHDLSMQQKNNVNVSGGTEKVKYFVSFGHLFQNGLLKQFESLPYDNNYKYNRYNYRANIDVALTPTTTMKLNIGGYTGKTNEPRTIESTDNPWVIATVWALPFGGPGIIDGKRTLLPGEMFPLEGERVRDGLFTFYGLGYNETSNTQLNFDLDITQKLDVLTKGLSASVKGAYDNNFTLNKYRAGGSVEAQIASYKSFLDDNTKPMTDPDYDKTIVYRPDPYVPDTPLTYAEDYGRDRNWYLEARINYKRSFGDHTVSGLALYNQNRNYYPNSYQYLPANYVGLVGRATYDYKKKYILDLNVGYNGSENFAPGKTRYGLFPAISGAWVATNENFMRNQKAIHYLKLRASWGRVGSDGGINSRFLYMPGIWNPSGSYSFGVNNPINQQGFGLGLAGNDLVTWETAEKQNYGIDLELFNGNLTINADYFTEHREGILIPPRRIPSVIATSLSDLNIGIVDNKGYELAIGWKDEISNNFSYHINANVSYAKNKIIYMDEVPNTYDYMNATGHSTDRYSDVYKYERLYQYSDFDQDADGNLTLKSEFAQPFVNVYPGDAMYADLNGDNIVNGDDKMAYGYSTRPEYFFGSNIGFEWKNFSVSTQWIGATHVNKMYEIEYRIPFTNAGVRGLLDYFVDESWTPENQLGATLPRAAETSESWNSQASTLWLRDASYIRLKTLTIGYTLRDNKFLRNFGIKTASFSLSGYNLLTFSSLKTMDPEGITNNLGSYPLTKQYNFGLNLNF
ncbi:SusC/RagA family TonB-linked outer membrane protein [Wocania ichthyoenteri]|uniref:SusC/RagA family TonB-linked outer membrane protein n=1 Tax=Wocania ichthyoenteri TaxID=1230531 RepID=UPI00053D0247|nr:TonB-dependent receptor [Wocania ichthyoenteri]